MEKTKLLTVVVIALLLLNLGTLGFLILAPKPGMAIHGHHPEPKEIIIRKLQFDRDQIEKYENLIVWHRSNIDKIEKGIYGAKNNLYLQLLKTDPDNKTTDSLINKIADYQKQVEMTHFTHFMDIKKICHPDQIKDYEKLTEELSNIFSKPPKPRER